MERIEPPMQSNFHHVNWYPVFEEQSCNWLMWSFRRKSKWTRTERKKMVKSPKREACHCLSWPKELIEGKRWREGNISLESWRQRDPIEFLESAKQRSHKLHTAERPWNTCLFTLFLIPVSFFPPPRGILDNGGTKLAKYTLQLESKCKKKSKPSL